MWGIEGTIDWTDIRGRGDTGIFIPADSQLQTNVNWIATIAGEVGWTVDHSLLYLKGGAAAIQVEITASDHAFTARTITTQLAGGAPATFAEISCAGCSDSETRWGWLFGAGVSFAFTNNWSAFLEYNDMFFGSHDFDISGIFLPLDTREPFTSNFDTPANPRREGRYKLNYKFDWTPAPVVARY